MDDVRNEKETAAAPMTRQASEQDAIRGAFLARSGHGEDISAGGGAGGDTGAATLRGAFMKHLTEKRSGAVVGDEAGGAGVVLRSIYAARSTVVSITAAAARPARKAKAAPAKAAPAKKRGRAATKRAQPAKRGPKKQRAAAPRRAAATRTVARAKKKKAKGRR